MSWFFIFIISTCTCIVHELRTQFSRSMVYIVCRGDRTDFILWLFVQNVFGFDSVQLVNTIFFNPKIYKVRATWSRSTPFTTIFIYCCSFCYLACLVKLISLTDGMAIVASSEVSKTVVHVVNLQNERGQS